MKVEVELDDLNELKDEIEHLQHSLANQTYMGNSIGYIYDKMKVYGDQVGLLGPFVRRAFEEGRLTIETGNEQDRKVVELLRLEI